MSTWASQPFAEGSKENVDAAMAPAPYSPPNFSPSAPRKMCPGAPLIWRDSNGKQCFIEGEVCADREGAMTPPDCSGQWGTNNFPSPPHPFYDEKGVRSFNRRSPGVSAGGSQGGSLGGSSPVWGAAAPAPGQGKRTSGFGYYGGGGASAITSGVAALNLAEVETEMRGLGSPDQDQEMTWEEIVKAVYNIDPYASLAEGEPVEFFDDEVGDGSIEATSSSIPTKDGEIDGDVSGGYGKTRWEVSHKSVGLTKNEQLKDFTPSGNFENM